MKSFRSEMTITCKVGLDLVSQKKTYSTDYIMLKRQPFNENHQMLPYYEGEYEFRQNIIDFESAKEILMKEDDRMVLKRRFQRIYNAIERRLTRNTKMFLKTKRFFFMDSNVLKQIKSIILV